jgi:hypothetical protein
MGFYFRKSARLGPIRLNFSKSGIGFSTGIKGARMVFSPKGTYVQLGRNGLYYRKHLSSKPNKNGTNQDIVDFPTKQIIGDNKTIIETVNFDNLTDIDSQVFIKELEEKDKKISFYNLLIFFGLLIIIGVSIYFFAPYRYQTNTEQFAIVKNDVVNVRQQNNISSNLVTQVHKGDKMSVIGDSTENNWIQVKKDSIAGYIFLPLVNLKTEVISEIPITRFSGNKTLGYFSYLFIIIALIIGLIKTFQLDKRRKNVEIYYELDDEMNELYEKFLNSFNSILSVNRIWQITTSSSGHDGKYHGGASTLVERTSVNEVTAHKLPMRHFQTNASIPFIGLRNIKLYFLPERLLIKKNGEYASIMYKNIKFSSDNSSFIEEGPVSNDAKIIDHTWRYVNKSGGPDRRFSNNRQIPICLYSNYYLNSDSGLNEIIQTSKLDGFKAFEDIVNSISHQQSKTKENEVQVFQSNSSAEELFDYLSQKIEFTKDQLELNFNYGLSTTIKILDLLQKIGAIEYKTGETYRVNHDKLFTTKGQLNKYFG